MSATCPPRFARHIAAFGHWLQRNARQVRALQWVVVVGYAALLIIPVFVPLPDNASHIWNHITVFAAFVFWGIWWPFVLLSMVLFGRLWCGLLCPEGALSEWCARHGLGWGIPKWIRWPGWPFVAFVTTTVYGQMISVYQYPKPALLILGGSTVAAMGIGFLYTRGKRAWCRYLCPVSGVFALLAKLAPMHYQVDHQAWEQASKPLPNGSKRIPIQAVDCPPMLAVRALQGASACHMCGRCSGYRDAVALSWRSPSQEIVQLAGTQEADRWQTRLIVFGLLGVAIGAFHWSASPWLIASKQWLAEWLIDRDIMWPFNDNIPWWLFTHYPEKNDAFHWLDAAVQLAYIFSTAIVWSSITTLLLAASVRIAGRWRSARLHHLAQNLIPMAGIGVFLGLSATTLTLLRGDGIIFFWANDVRLALMLGSAAWTLWLARGIVRGWQSGRARSICSMLVMLLLTCWINSAWGWLFWWW